MRERTIDQRYRLVRFLGRGGFGEVFLASDLVGGGDVALKVIDHASSDVAQLKRRLLREARATQALDPARVARVLSVGESEEGELYLVMPFVDGQTLREVVRGGAATTDDILRIVSELAVTLDAAHSAGLVHRDVKPDNVMVSPDGRVVLLDFGIVKAVADESDGSAYASTQLTRTGSAVGTVAYAAPEQALGRSVDARADQFALGVMAFELLTGRVPWEGDIPARILTQLLYEEAPRASAFRPSLSAAVDLTLRRALEKRPDARFPSVRAFAGALEEAIRNGVAPPAAEVVVTATGDHASAAGTTGGASRPRPARRIVWASLALAGLAAVGGGVAASRGAFRRPATGWWSGARATIAVPRATSGARAACPEWLASEIAEGLTSQLGAGGKVRAIGPRELGPLANAAGTSSVLRRAFGADAVVQSTCVGGKADAAEVRVRVVSTGEPQRELASFTVTGSGGAPSDLVSRMTGTLRRDLGVEAPDALELARAERTLPSDASVARAYVEGLTKLEAFDGVGAREALHKVVAADPQFAPGHAALAAACSYLGEQREAAREGALAAAGAASLPNEERLLVSADAAAARYAWDEALETYRAIVRVFPDRRDVALKLIRVAIDAGRPKDARAAMEDLKQHTGPDSSDPRVYLDEAQVANMLGESAGVTEGLRKAEALADEVGLPAVKAQALLTECKSFSGAAHGDARDPCAEAQKIFESLGDRMGALRAEGGRFYLLLQGGDIERARALADHTRTIADALGSPDARSGAEMETTLLAMAEGKVDVWKKSGRASVEQADLGGNAPSRVGSRINLGGALVDNGDLDEGRDVFEEALAIAREAGMKSSQAIILQNLVGYYIPKGAIALALQRANEALEMLAPDSFDRAWALDALGNAELEADALPAAREHCEQALVLRQRSHVSTAGSHQNLAELLLDTGDLDGALREASTAEDEFTEAGVALGRGIASVVLARVYLARRDLPKATAAIDAAMALAKEAQSSTDGFVPVRMRALLLAGKRTEALAAGDPLPKQELASRYARLVRAQVWVSQGQRERARGDLEALEKEAHEAGNLRVEHEAVAVLAGKDVEVP